MVWRSPILHCGRRACRATTSANGSSADCEGRRGYRRAQVIASHADGLSENGGESRFRAFFIAYGFPVPELQVEFRDPLDLSQVFRVDYFWRLEDGTCVIGELDGKGKYALQNGEGRESVDPFVAERQRESHLTMLGHKVLRLTFDELKNPGKLVEKMRLAGIPRRPDLAEEWRASVVWALKQTVSICNNKGPFGLVTVTDQDKRLATARRSSICNI